MALESGKKLGPYEIVAAAGAGGMGEVYRARDTRLDRTVAIKVLPTHLSSDTSLRQRLDREARAVSKLTHPNICTLHDVGHQDGVDFLVLEYVEGETLERRLERGPLPSDQVLKYAIEIAHALETAHRQGIVHRDLKPGNIILTKSGAKLLDFGLAKLGEPETARVAAALTEMTAENKKLTADGALPGTFQYMAPEQLEGQAADARTDIFAFGATVYEMATARPAFAGRSKASLIASILSSEPPPMSSLQPMTPAALERVVRQCLAKDPDERIQTTHDLRLQLEWIRDSGSQISAAVPPRVVSVARKHWTAGVAAVAFLLGIVLAYAFWRMPQQAPQRPVRSSILPPDKASFSFLGTNGTAALSPDGRTLAFVGHSEKGNEVWVRPLDADSAHPLTGTDDAIQVFWSPDSHDIGFFSQGKLKRVAAAGGPALTLCDVDAGPRGGSWSSQNMIIYGSWPGLIYKVPATGGAPQKATDFDPSRHDTTHRWPVFLPDGNHFLYMASPFGSYNEDNVFALGSLDGKTNRILFHGSSNIGKKFALNFVGTEETPTPLSMIQNWPAELKNVRPDSR